MPRALHGVRLRSLELARAVMLGHEQRARQIARRVLESEAKEVQRRAAETAKPAAKPQQKGTRVWHSNTSLG
ncbi:hypothetical protein QTH90_00200 [Variovorax sp. J2P1-59]|uniref:hypothetical protein n=1 Tax=Variovorax flavidus TaxID=3053501 RepID=UPI0025751B3E|nr:hypothetical protein [Variovorax sp. J2P1-59]MDM0072785.1 hypothetical protein [Variovorax sp. J2P1-59]